MTALVTKHLPLVAGASDGIKKLRALILELAVRGKLVEQDSADEAAEFLLNRIATQRGKHSKATKPIAPMSDEDSIYPLPIGWVWTRLASQVLESGAGWSPSCEARQRVGNEWGVLKVSAVSWGTFSPDENKALPANLEPRPEHEVSVGDFLVSRANTSELVARSVVVDATAPRLMLSDKIVRLKLTPDCSSRYINLVNTCPAARRYYGAVAGGTSSSMKNVSREQILHLPLPLPPLAEQHRIVAKVDELMALCDRLEADQADAEAAHAQLVQALLDSLIHATDDADFRASWQRLSEHFHTLFTTEASIDALKQTVLQLAVMGRLYSQCSTDDNVEHLLAAIKSKKAELHQERLIAKPRSYVDSPEFDPPFDIPSAWRWARLGELGITSTGSTPPTSRPECFGGTTPFIGPGQIDVNGQISFGDKSLSDVGLVVSTIASPGDILMVCIGGSIGKSAMAQARIAFNQQINSISVLHANGGYVNLATMSPYFQSQVLAAATGSATPIINRTKWEDICVPVPPLAEQHRIVAKVDELIALCDQLKAQLAKARHQHAQLATVLVEQAVAA